jgi:hypothetical protein
MIALGQTPIHPITEPSLHRMLEWLKANEPKPKPEWTGPSPAQRIADEELQRVLNIHDTLIKQIATEQRLCQRITVKERAAALGMVVDDAMMEKPVALHMSVGQFYSVPETRAAAAQVSALVYALHEKLSKLETISKLDRLDPDQIVMHMGARMSALEARLSAAETELEQLRQQPKRKASK